MRYKKQYKKIFQDEFDGIAKYYDKIEPVPLALHKMIHNLMPENKNTFLELGCGTGRLLKMMIPEFKYCTALDFSKEMINIAKKRISSKAKFIHCSVDEMDFKDESFDYIVCNALFHHLHNDKKRLIKTLKKIKHILKLKGRLFISDFVTYKSLRSKQDWIHYLYLISKTIKKDRFNIISEIKKEPYIFRKHLVTERGMFFTKKEFYEWFGSSFKNSKIEYFGRTRDLIKIYYLIWDKE